MRKGSVPTQDHGKKQKLENLDVTEWPARCSGLYSLLSQALLFLKFLFLPAADPGFVGLKGIHLEERGTISEKRIQNCKQNSV